MEEKCRSVSVETSAYCCRAYLEEGELLLVASRLLTCVSLLHGVSRHYFYL